MAWRMLAVCDLYVHCSTSEPLHKPDTPKIERTKDDLACSFLLFSLVQDQPGKVDVHEAQETHPGEDVAAEQLHPAGLAASCQTPVWNKDDFLNMNLLRGKETLFILVSYGLHKSL
jgi:hypothetical protein